MQRPCRICTFYTHKSHKHICLRSWMTKLTWQGSRFEWFVCVDHAIFARATTLPQSQMQTADLLEIIITTNAPFQTQQPPIGPVQFHTIPQPNPCQPLSSYLPLIFAWPVPQPQKGKSPLLCINWKATGKPRVSFSYRNRKPYRGTHVANAGCQPLRCSFHLLWRSCDITGGFQVASLGNI